MGLHQTKILCTIKESINEMKRSPTIWEKIFINDIYDKRLVSKTYKKLIKLNTKNTQTI